MRNDDKRLIRSKTRGDKETSQNLLVELEKIASGRGFHRNCDFPELGGDYRICFCKDIGVASTRALCFVIAIGPPRLLRVEFVGSMLLDIVELMRRGLELNGFAENLFDFQFDVLALKAEEILPADIPLPKAYDHSALLSRIESEIYLVEPLVWTHYFAPVNNQE